MKTTAAPPTTRPAPAGRRPRWAAPLAWAFLGLVITEVALALYLYSLAPPVFEEATSWGSGTWFGLVVSNVAVLGFAGVGAFLGARKPDNLIGWAFIGSGFLLGLNNIAVNYAIYAEVVRGGALPLAAEVDWFSLWAWLPGLMFVVSFVPQVFPEGRVTPDGRRLAIFTGAALGLGSIGAAIAPGPLQDIGADNPFAVEPLAFLEYAFVLLLPAVVVPLWRLVRRFRRSSGDERLQLKWFVSAASLAGATLVMAGTITGGSGGEDAPAWMGVVQDLPILFFGAIPVATAIAILRYRLFEIDVIINRTVVFGVLAAFITAVYVAIVIGIGTGLGASGNRLLPAAAAGVIAVAFQPVRQRAHAFANRVVFGKRATPYEALSGFADRLAGTYSSGDVLPRLAQLVTEATVARDASVWVCVGGDIRRAAAWPAERAAVSVPFTGDALPPLPGSTHAFGVRHQGELLGAIAVSMPPGEELAATEEKLLGDLTSHAGLLLANVRLIAELQASRQRLVTAQDAERRRIERNLHDGAQQQLVALSVKLGLLDRTLDDRDTARDLVGQLQAESRDALETLRDLARGIYPPLLADRGLAAALAAQADKAALPVRIDADGLGRYPQEAEAAVYFCVLEALQNVAKYARASEARVRLGSGDERLTFEVTDDGAGFDPRATARGAGLTNMADRIEALGGRFEVRSSPGSGTTVSGHIPAG